MKARSSRREVRSAKCEVWCVCWLALSAVEPLLAATNSSTPVGKPFLLPPHPELPPPFWEQHGLWVALAGLVLFALAALAAWRRWRPKPPVVIPIEVQTRRELEQLRGQPEDGRALSQVSRSLRHYLAVAFELAPEELTTSEFCRAAEASDKVGPDLAAQAGEFLRRCDELKFSPTASPRALDAAAHALELVERGEARRAQWRAAPVPAGAPSAAATA